ncbi:MAG: hypothetical protein DRJ97_03935 [Thermoprotei archaeon]|nr:MAG: hypothetical protein DRJ97_03935 [Thermoprotei archaeon]
MEVKLYGKPKAEELVMVAGLPGMGYVAKQAVDYLIEELKASPFGEVSSLHLYPSVVLFNDGLMESFLEKRFYRFYLSEVGRRGFIFFTGEAQPSSAEGQRALADKVAEAVAKLGVKKVFTMAAYPVPRYVEEPKVYAVATNSSLLQHLVSKGISVMPGRSSISGMNGLLLEYMAYRGVEGACLLSETYVIDSADVKAAAALVKKLKEILEVDVNTARIEEMAARFDEDLHRQYEGLRKAKEVEKGLGYIY